MHDDDGLSPSALDALEQRLRGLKVETERLLASTQEGARPVDLDQPIGRLSRMEAIQQQQMTRAARSRAHVRLRQIQAALELIKQGDYGYCRVCDDPIDRARLHAKPESLLCMTCQEASEAART